MCYVFCLMINFFCLAINVSYENLHEDNINACLVLGYVIMTFTWMNFLWLNVLAFDIWSAFSVKYNRNLGRRFIFYCLYAFGFPLLLNLVIFIIHTYDLIPSDYQHKIGQDMCLSSSAMLDSFIYTYLPMIYTLILNTILFSLTGYEINKMKKFDIGKRHSENETAR